MSFSISPKMTCKLLVSNMQRAMTTCEYSAWECQVNIELYCICIYRYGFVTYVCILNVLQILMSVVIILMDVNKTVITLLVVITALAILDMS